MGSTMTPRAIPDDTPVEKAAAPFIAASMDNDPRLVHIASSQAQARLRRDLRRGATTREAAEQALKVVEAKCGDENPAAIALRELLMETEPTPNTGGRPKTFKTRASEYRGRIEEIRANRQSEREIHLLIAEILCELVEGQNK